MGIADIQRRYAGQVTASLIDEKSLDKLKNEGGFSHHILTGEEPKGGYMVGLHQHMGGDEAVVPMHELTADHIAKHRDQFRGAMTARGEDLSHMYQGGWQHEGHAYLDRSVNVDDEHTAREMGHAHKQLAIWDVANKREVPLGE